jgi:hypothetical protein
MATKLEKLLVELKKASDAVDDKIDAFLDYQMKSPDRDKNPEKYFEQCKKLEKEVATAQKKMDSIMNSMKTWKKVIDKAKSFAAFFKKAEEVVELP